MLFLKGCALNNKLNFFRAKELNYVSCPSSSNNIKTVNKIEKRELWLNLLNILLFKYFAPKL